MLTNAANLLSNYGEAFCQSLAGAPLDRFVSEQVLKAFEPASLELSFEVAQNIERQRSELDALWQKRLERARYESERAARQYHLVEPENRLVARQLERDWEEKLTQAEQLREEYDRFLREQPRLLTVEEREAIRRLAADIPALWESPKTTAQERKEIIREVIERIVVDVVGQSERVKIRIEWAGGMETHHEIVRPVARFEQLSYWPQLAERIRELASENLNAQQIAERLNREGWRPPKRREQFGKVGVQALMNRLGLTEKRSRSLSRAGLRDGEWWLSSLARELDMPVVTLYTWLRRGWIKGRRTKQGRWAVWADPGELDRLRELRKVPRGHHSRRRWTEAQNSKA